MYSWIEIAIVFVITVSVIWTIRQDLKKWKKEQLYFKEVEILKEEVRSLKAAYIKLHSVEEKIECWSKYSDDLK